MTEQELPQRVRVIEPHVTNDPNPVRFRAGDTHRRRTSRPGLEGYIWATDAGGPLRLGARRVPGDHRDDARPSALRDYDSTELTVGRKEILEVLDEAGGWYLCRTQSGHSGWVPSTSVEPVEAVQQG